MVIELNEHEAAALVQLIHLAVQARGMEVAEAGVVLTKRIKDAMTSTKAPMPLHAVEAG